MWLCRSASAVSVPGGEVADVEPDPGEAGELGGLSLAQEAIRDAALIEDLDGACVQAAGARIRRAPVARRSTTATSIPASASSAASISPVGPPPAITTAW